MEHEYAAKPADTLARRTRLAFLNSTAARLTLRARRLIFGTPRPN